jgi:O-antigen ligase
MTPDKSQRWNQLFYMTFFAVLILLNVQFLTIDGVSNEESSIRLYHIASVALVLWLPLAWCLRTVPWTVHLFFITVGVSTAAASQTYGLSIRAILIPYGMFMVCIGAAACRRLGRERVLKSITQLFAVLHVLVVLRILYYIVTEGDLPRAVGGRPDMMFFYAGGNNLESTWLAASLVLFSRSRFFVPLCCNSAFIAVTYGSRTGLLLTGVSIAIVLMSSPGWVKWMLRGVMLVAGGIVFLTATEIGEAMADRFANIGDSSERGSSARLDIWTAAQEAIERNPLGYGIGKSHDQISLRQSLHVEANNVHNVFLQMALDGGVQTLVAWLLMIAHLTARAWRQHSDLRVASFLMVYLAGCMVQFTGYESITWLMVGILIADQAPARDSIPARAPVPTPAPRRPAMPGYSPVPIPIPIRVRRDRP